NALSGKPLEASLPLPLQDNVTTPPADNLNRPTGLPEPTPRLPKSPFGTEFAPVRLHLPRDTENRVVNSLHLQGEEGLYLHSATLTDEELEYRFSGDDLNERLYALVSTTGNVPSLFHHAPVRFYVPRYVPELTAIYAEIAPNNPGVGGFSRLPAIDEQEQSVLMGHYQRLYVTIQAMLGYYGDQRATIRVTDVKVWYEFLRTAHVLSWKHRLVLDDDPIVDFAVKKLTHRYQVMDRGWNNGPCKFLDDDRENLVIIDGHSSIDAAQLCTNVRNSLIYLLKTLYNSLSETLKGSAFTTECAT